MTLPAFVRQTRNRAESSHPLWTTPQSLGLETRWRIARKARVCAPFAIASDRETRFAARCVASKRVVAGDGAAMAVAALRVVIPRRQMLGAAIVPERDRAWAPSEAALKFGIFEVPEEHLENCVALAVLQLHDSSGEHPIHVKLPCALSPDESVSPDAPRAGMLLHDLERAAGLDSCVYRRG